MNKVVGRLPEPPHHFSYLPETPPLHQIQSRTIYFPLFPCYDLFLTNPYFYEPHTALLLQYSQPPNHYHYHPYPTSHISHLLARSAYNAGNNGRHPSSSFPIPLLFPPLFPLYPYLLLALYEKPCRSYIPHIIQYLACFSFSCLHWATRVH